MVSTGWMTVGKTVIYPVRPGTAATGGRPLINWVAELERPQAVRQDWTGRGKLSDIMPAFAGLTFDLLDISGMIESTEEILEYPMVDRDPLDRWTFGRLTLLGDAAHPMYPRGFNGAGQAIVDARFLTGRIKQLGATQEALEQYEAGAIRDRQVVLTNRTDPPNSILREVWQRSKGERFDRIEDVISISELETISDRYKKIAGFDRETFRTRPSFVYYSLFDKPIGAQLDDLRDRDAERSGGLEVDDKLEARRPFDRQVRWAGAGQYLAPSRRPGERGR